MQIFIFFAVIYTELMIIEQHTEPAKPFLRWAGGKKWFIQYLKDFLPKDINNYYEPFVGSGAAFFSLETSAYKQAYLSDLNDDLINTYSQLRDNVENIIRALKSYNNSESDYYDIRAKQNIKSHSKRAARFIYLNKTSFNGIYRVNNKGEYNVPYGHRKNVDLVCEQNLRRVCQKLQNVAIESVDFEVALRNVQKNDFVFIDPPYTVAHENNGFIEYNQKIFSLEDQIRLAALLQEVASRGAYYVLTNAKHDKILEIYQGLGKPTVLTRPSNIGGIGAVRDNVKEYIFTNCVS